MRRSSATRPGPPVEPARDHTTRIHARRRNAGVENFRTFAARTTAQFAVGLAGMFPASAAVRNPVYARQRQAQPQGAAFPDRVARARRRPRSGARGMSLSERERERAGASTSTTCWSRRCRSSARPCRARTRYRDRGGRLDPLCLDRADLRRLRARYLGDPQSLIRAYRRGARERLRRLQLEARPRHVTLGLRGDTRLRPSAVSPTAVNWRTDGAEPGTAAGLLPVGGFSPSAPIVEREALSERYTQVASARNGSRADGGSPRSTTRTCGPRSRGRPPGARAPSGEGPNRGLTSRVPSLRRRVGIGEPGLQAKTRDRSGAGEYDDDQHRREVSRSSAVGTERSLDRREVEYASVPRDRTGKWSARPAGNAAF